MNASTCSGVYNGVGVVKGHASPVEPGAWSRAVRRFLSGRSSQTLDAATGSHKLRVGTKPRGFFRGFVLSGLFRLVPTEARLLNPAVGRWYLHSSMRS